MRPGPAVLNPVVARLTLSGLLGRRRALVLLLLPGVLLAVVIVFRLVGGVEEGVAVELLDGLGLGTMLPVLCVIVGTATIGPEIEDGSIVYLLSKPLPRGTIIRTKLAVAVLTSLVLGAVPIWVAGIVLLGTRDDVALTYAVVAAVATLGYCALFLLLGTLTSNAVVIGLVYAILWETTVAGLVPGARAVSIRQWAGAVGRAMAGPDAGRIGLTSGVSLPVGVVLLAVTVVGATWWATVRLRRLSLGTQE